MNAPSRLEFARRRLVLSAAELAAALALLGRGAGGSAAGVADAVDDAADGAGAETLERRGLLREGRMADVLADALGVVVRPALQAVVEVHAVGDPVVVATLSATMAAATLVEHVAGDDWLVRPVPLPRLAWVLADQVGLDDRPVPAVGRPLSLGGPVLERAFHAAAAADPAEVEAALAGAPLGDGERAAVHRLLAERRLSWRITVTANRDQRTLAVIDGGDAGLWRSQRLVPDDPEAGALLTPLSTAQVWQALKALLT